MLSVDQNIEYPLTGGSPGDLREVQVHRIRSSRSEIRDRVGERAPAHGLIDILWRRVGNQRCIDGRPGGRSIAASEIGVSHPGSTRRAAAVNLNDRAWPSSCGRGRRRLGRRRRTGTVHRLDHVEVSGRSVQPRVGKRCPGQTAGDLVGG